MAGPRKPVYIKPFPTTRKVKPYEFPTLVLPDCEHDLFDSIAQEHVRVLGTDIDFYSQQLTKGVRDPLYDEPLKRNYLGPFRMKGYIVWPDDTPDVSDKGFRTIWNAEAWIPRLEFEAARCPTPNQADVLRCWNVPFFHEWASDLIDDEPAVGYYFDVLNVNDDGHLFDSSQFVGFKMLIKRRSEFTPERRINNT